MAQAAASGSDKHSILPRLSFQPTAYAIISVLIAILLLLAFSTHNRVLSSSTGSNIPATISLRGLGGVNQPGSTHAVQLQQPRQLALTSAHHLPHTKPITLVGTYTLHLDPPGPTQQTAAALQLTSSSAQVQAAHAAAVAGTAAAAAAQPEAVGTATAAQFQAATTAAASSNTTAAAGSTSGAAPKAAATAGAVKVFVGVLSRGSDFEGRQIARETWGADKRLARVMFFTLRPASNDTWRRLRLEAELHGDVITTSEVAEDYYRITHSTIAIFRAAAALSHSVTHVLKTDVDCYIRVGLLLDALEAAPKDWLFAGFPWDITKTLPGVRYGFGWGYVVTVDIARHVAAGVPDLLVAPTAAEDDSAGRWVEYIAKDRNKTLSYTGWQWGSNPKCDNVPVIHTAGNFEMLRCMHARGGACCF